MAVRKYDDESNVAVKAIRAEASREPDEWERREARRAGLEIARALSEVGSKASDVVADAEIYADYILEG